VLNHARLVCNAAYAHQEVPFQQIVHALGLSRTADQMPLVQVTFALQNAREHTLQLSGLSLESLPIGACAAAFDLTFGLSDRRGRLVGELNYSCDLYSRETARTLAHNFVVIADTFVQSPDTRVMEIPLGLPQVPRDLSRVVADACDFTF
jgi:non-ribosomal peptide synthetase component F